MLLFFFLLFLLVMCQDDPDFNLQSPPEGQKLPHNCNYDTAGAPWHRN